MKCLLNMYTFVLYFSEYTGGYRSCWVIIPSALQLDVKLLYTRLNMSSFASDVAWFWICFLKIHRNPVNLSLFSVLLSVSQIFWDSPFWLHKKKMHFCPSIKKNSISNLQVLIRVYKCLHEYVELDWNMYQKFDTFILPALDGR